MRVAQSKIRRKKNVKKGIQFSMMVCGASGTGMFVSSFSNFNSDHLQAAPPLSTPSAADESFNPKTQMMQPMPILRKA
jgi:septin family protein